MIPPISDIVQLGVAGMAILAMVALTMFFIRHLKRDADGTLKVLLAQSQKREEALAYSLEKSREDRLRLETIIEQNTEAWREALNGFTRFATIVEMRHG